MKLSIYILAVSGLFVIGCSNSTEPKPTEEDSTIVEEAPATEPMNLLFPDLYQYFQSQDPSFTSEGFEEGETSVLPDSSDFKMDSAGLKIFLPYLLFNADSSYALDPVSYNFHPQKRKGKIKMQEMGPDFEAAIIDMKTKDRKRLLFFGPSGGAVLDAGWKNDSTVVMAGAIDWNSADSLRPVLWKYNVRERILQPFIYNKKIRANWSGYPKKIYELNAQSEPSSFSENP